MFKLAYLLVLPWSGLFQVGVSDGVGVALGAFDAEPEQVADAADVAAGRVVFLEDAVFSKGLGSEIGLGPWELFADGPEAGRAAYPHEQVRI